MDLTTHENKPPILHIIVVGFHHKMGCQVEFSYPPLISGTQGKNECPSGWKYLPTLALPDGSHNFVEDTVFFNLPSLMDPTESVFGVSCYRQIPVEKLKIRTADVTRSTVQKSVCILARLPIYGYIEVKLSLIADAFFEQGDFSCTKLLIKAYHQLNDCLLDDESQRPLRHFHVGLSLREIIVHWRHKMLILFKLFLLQRRVVCFGSPVRNMCTLILGIASLMPRLLEKGFQEVACVRTSRPLSPMPDFTASLKRASVEAIPQQPEEYAAVNVDVPHAADQQQQLSSKEDSPELASCLELADDYALVSSAASASESGASGELSPPTQSTPELHRLDSTEVPSEQNKLNERSSSLTRESSIDTLATSLLTLTAVNPSEYRAPITIFTSGNLCLPYLSLPYMDLLTDPSVLSYVIGTSNVLFQQKRQLADVLIDIENANIDAHDQELRRQIALSTEDLRFMDYLMKHVQAPKEDAEGSEQWIRDQFQGYMLALLRTAVASDVTSKECDHFNALFMNAFKKTQCFQEWFDVRPDDEFFEPLPAGHPFAGTLSVSDMKLKIAQTMQNSESGRKLNQAVNTTSRAVGGAISQAKGAFSNWWSSITTAPATVASSNTNEASATAAVSDAMTAAQVQDIVVSFQNNNVNQPEIAEAVVNIHIDESALTHPTSEQDEQATNNEEEEGIEAKPSSASISGSDKLVDSAEELEEDAIVLSKEEEDQQQLPTEEQATLAEATASDLLDDNEDDDGGGGGGGGIVEIGHEAEILDKSASAQLPATCAGDAATSSIPNRSNGGVFIV